MATSEYWEGWKKKNGRMVSTNRTDILPKQTTSRLPSAALQTPTLSADEVQNVVAQNTGAPTPAAVQGNSTANANAAANAATSPLMVSGMGLNGGQRALIPGTAGPYRNVYNNAMEQTLNDLLNPKPYSYDVNADGLYQQIKDNYIKQGKQAMMDTQGQSAALTGGYGNSYGVQAGQQAYQESLGNLAGMIPELSQLAWQQYQQGQDDKRNNLEAMNKLEAQEYARWLDEQQMMLEWYKAFPELAMQGLDTSGSTIKLTGGVGVGAPTAMDIANLVNSGKAGTTGSSNIYNPDQYLALDGLSDSQKKAFFNIISNGGNLSGIDPNTATRWANDYAAANGLGSNMPTVGLKIAGTKAVTGTNGAGNNNVVFTSNAGNEELNAGLNTNKKTYNGLFNFNKH